MGGLLKGGIVVVVIVAIFGAWYAFTGTSGAPKGDPLTVTDQDWSKGPKDAPVTLIEYTDFQCPACGAYYPVVKRLMESESGARVRLVIRHFPLLQIHPNALVGARATEAAGRQGKFWEMYDKLFSNQREWSGVSDPKGSVFPGYAEELGLNVDQFKKDLEDAGIDERINQNIAAANALGVNATPTFYVNGEKIENPKSYEDFKALIDAKLAQAPAPSSPKPAEPVAVHEHADFKVYINGKAINFAQAKYQSEEGNELDEAVHLHDGNGGIIHKHEAGVTLGRFFRSLKMDFTKDCLAMDTGERYCSDGKNTLQMYVNGAQNDTFGDYEFHDLDRILITYGPARTKEQLASQLVSVGDQACIYSEKCPERGKPPTENCVGGLGTNCE